MSPFQGCRDRVDRASAHRKTLGKLWADFLEDDPYYPSIDMQDDGTGTIYVRQDHPLPASIALELGEALYQLRAALDGCIYQAAIIESGENPPPNENRLEFPICSRAAEFRNSTGKTAPLPQKYRDFIEAVQPYTGPKLSSELEVISINRSLGILSDWARKDRHRQLHIVGSWISNANPKIRVPEGARLKSVWPSGDGFLKNDSQIAHFEIEGFIPGMKVQANPDLSIDIGVDEIPPPHTDTDTLGNRLAGMVAAVGLVIDHIEDLALGKASDAVG